MAKYRKKPIEIEAVQVRDLLYKTRDTWPAWANDARESAVLMFHTSTDPAGNYIIVTTKEGLMRGEVDDWLIQGVKGELYPCKPDIFEATYEHVE